MCGCCFCYQYQRRRVHGASTLGDHVLVYVNCYEGHNVLLSCSNYYHVTSHQYCGVPISQFIESTEQGLSLNDTFFIIYEFLCTSL